MKDFNSSDYIVKKGNNYIGISLKKKKRLGEADPTLINKSLASMLIAFETDADNKFKSSSEQLTNKISEFYSLVIIENIKNFPKKDQADIQALLKGNNKKKQLKILIGSGNKRPWKTFVKSLSNEIINKSLKSKSSVFKDMDDIIIKGQRAFANSLVQLIFKADLKDLKEVNFDFALVTGVGRYLKTGPVIEKGEYKDIDTMTTVLDDLFSNGTPTIERDGNVKQAFEFGATAATLAYVLKIGKVPLVNLELRYKGSFTSSPSFQAKMRPEFKALFK